MIQRNRISTRTRSYWIVDFFLSITALLAALTGIYFLFYVSGGYQGGRNPSYGVTILFDRTTWDILHTWTGVGMIAAVLIHITLHWKWVATMVTRTIKGIFGRLDCLNRGAQLNFWLNVIVAVSFLTTAVSGIYFLFFPGGSHGVSDPNLLFTRTTWDIIHTWSGVSLIITAIAHFLIHWKWIANVTTKIVRGATSRTTPTGSVSEG